MISKLNIKSILIIAIIGVLSLVFFNKSFAAVTGKVNVDTANIRKETDEKSTILEQASKGENVEVVEKKDSWYKVKYNGIQGYVRADLLEVSGEVTQTNTENNDAQTEPVTDTQKTETEQTNNNTETENAETQVQTEETNKQEENTATENQIENDVVQGMYTTTSDIQLKLIPLVNGNNIKDVAKDTTINVLEVYNNWALAECGMDRGWVLVSKIQKVEENAAQPTNPQQEEKKEDEQKPEEKVEEKTEQKAEQTTEVAVAETKMYINWDVVNLREKATKTSTSLASLKKGTEVVVFAKDNEWSKVKVNGKEGYIKTSLLSATKPEVTTSRALEQERQQTQAQVQAQETPAQAQPATQSTGSGMGQQVCDYARNYLGCKYVYGGTTPNGFDCSGFTQYVYKHFGVNLNRTAEAQASNGTYVAKSDLKAGDLVIFSHHAGIYLGNGTFIHAANSGTGVVTTSLSDSYYVRNYITARRIFN